MKTQESLRDLIAPLSVKEFLARHWEKTYLHLEGVPNRFDRYFSLGDIDTWLTAVRSGLPDSIIVASPEGAETRSERFRPRDITADNARTAFTKGCSLILNHLEDWPPLIALVKSLGCAFHADVGVNAYLTPQGGRTFPIHTDEHDTLILHLAGEKLWRLHEFSLLQVGLPQKLNLRFSREWYGRTQTPQLAEILLQPGDLLYIPRGMPHYAVAQDHTCLHLTISITPLYWMDFLKIAAEYAAIHSQELRRALPPGFVEDDEICASMRGAFHEVMKIFQEVTSFEDVLAAVKRDRTKFQGHPASGRFAPASDSEGLRLETEVERRQDVLCVVDEVFDPERRAKVAIFFADRHVNAPLRLRRALEFIRDHRRFRASEIPGLDEKGQLTLVRRLITDGLLQRASPSEPVRLFELETSVEAS